MSTENITAFFAKLNADPFLADKVSHAQAEVFAKLGLEAGLPFTAEEWLTAQSELLADEELGQVSGGVNPLGKPYSLSKKNDYFEKLAEQDRQKYHISASVPLAAATNLKTDSAS